MPNKWQMPLDHPNPFSLSLSRFSFEAQSYTASAPVLSKRTGSSLHVSTVASHLDQGTPGSGRHQARGDQEEEEPVGVLGSGCSRADSKHMQGSLKVWLGRGLV